MSYDPYDFDPADTGSNFLGPGQHTVTVTDHELGESGNGTPSIRLTFTGGGGGEHNEYFYLSEKARWRLGRVFTACGWTSKVKLSDPGMVKKALYGKPLSISLVTDTSGQKPRTALDVMSIAPSKAAPGRRPLSPSSEPPPRDTDEPPPHDDGDIPF